MPTPPHTLTERFATIILWLSQAVDTQRMWGKLPRPIGQLIIERLRGIKQRFARLAARLAAGTYRPRRYHGRKPAERKPRQKNPLPSKAGWLSALLPDAAGYRGHLDSLLRDAEMAALIAAAPASMRRPLRSLCRMLGLPPPDILALPAKPRKPREILPAPKPPPPQPQPPEWLRGLRRSLPQFARPRIRPPRNRA